MSRVRFKPLARGDLNEIWNFIAQDNVSAATRLTDTIEEKCRLVATNPEMGRAREELATSLRSFPVGHHVIFYRHRDGVLEVVRILHAARDIRPLVED